MRTLNRFLKNRINFGDFLIIQKYSQKEYKSTGYDYEISKPKLIIYLGYFTADQTMGFNYVEYINQDKTIKEEYEFKDKIYSYRTNCVVDEIKEHIEWNDYIDILGHYKSRPNFKEILAAFRLGTTKEVLNSSEIKWK